MATIVAGCVGLTALLFNFTPLALPIGSADSNVTRVIAQALGATMMMAQPNNPFWKLDSKSGCTNDLVETNAVHVAIPKGTMKVSLATGVPVHCGHPLGFHNVTVQSQMVTELRQPSSVENSNLLNFDEAALFGDGTSIHYDDQSAITQISLAEQLSDQTLVGSAHVNQQNGRTIITNAHMTVYQNVLNVVGQGELKNLVFADSCCTPVGGTITAHLTAGSNVAPTTEGSHFVGKVETLTFDGCGSAQLKDVDGHRSHLPVQCM